ncbi:MAG: hypothetical protein IKZ53_10730 [Selenomonadaceae bacterium]|nr:hypothetical protein [Selenomonadaceae bacterium]
MTGENVFVPNVLICGDEEEFLSQIGTTRPFKIVGHVQFRGEANGHKFDFEKDEQMLLDDKLCNAEELSKMIRGGGMILSFSTPVQNYFSWISIYRNSVACADTEFLQQNLNTYQPITSIIFKSILA